MKRKASDACALNVKVNVPNPPTAEPDENMVRHLNDQWTTAMLEILRERGYKAKIDMVDGMKSFKVVWEDGIGASDDEMSEVARLAVAKMGHRVEE